MVSVHNYLDKVYRVFDYTGRPFLKRAWEEIVKNDLVVVEAPTGYGKTCLSQALALYDVESGFKTIIAYPIRSILEDHLSKFKELFDKIGVENAVGTRYMHHQESYYFVKPVTLTTIDTLSMGLFGLEPGDLDRVLGKYLGVSITRSIGHYLFSRASVLLSNIVLDEVHLLADSTKSLNFLLALTIIAQQNNSKLLLQSATLPSAFKNRLKEYHRDITFIEFREDDDPDFIEERENKEIDYKKPVEVSGDDKYRVLLDMLNEARNSVKKYGLRALLVFNTVNEAIEMYNYLVNNGYKNYEIILLHSRFKEGDRLEKIEKLRELTRKYKKSLNNRKNNAKNIEYIVIATQVIEAGVDITSNVFITDIAPANSLIQRLGRFLRFRGEKYGVLRIWYEKIKDKQKYYKVYDLELTKKTLEQLRGLTSFNPHIPSHYHKLIDSVYSIEDFPVKYNEVSELVILTLSLTHIKGVIDKFIELNGSFVRDTLLVPVITEKEWIEWRNTGNARKLETIPASIHSLKHREVIGAIIKKHDRYELIKINSRNLFKIALKNNFVALVVKGVYDPAKGLMF